MMSSNNLAILTEPADREEAISLMKARRIEKLLITNGTGKLTGLLTLRDTEQAVLNPNACKDQLGRLRVAAASTVGDDGFDRSQALVDAGVDMIVIGRRGVGIRPWAVRVNNSSSKDSLSFCKVLLRAG